MHNMVFLFPLACSYVTLCNKGNLEYTGMLVKVRNFEKYGLAEFRLLVEKNNMQMREVKN